MKSGIKRRIKEIEIFIVTGFWIISIERNKPTQNQRNLILSARLTSFGQPARRRTGGRSGYKNKSSNKAAFCFYLYPQTQTTVQQLSCILKLLVRCSLFLYRLHCPAGLGYLYNSGNPITMFVIPEFLSKATKYQGPLASASTAYIGNSFSLSSAIDQCSLIFTQ